MSPKVSVVIPVYNSEQTLESLVGELAFNLTADWMPFEIVLVDDGSNDNSWAKIQQLASQNSSVYAIRLSRNFGQHHAVLAGVERSRGEVTVVMDCDLQDRPEDIPKVLAKLAEGFDIVATRTSSSHRNCLRRTLRRAYFRLISWSSSVKVEPNLGTIVAFNQKVREAFLSVRDQHRHTNLVLAWLGFKRASVEVQKPPSNLRRSGYSFARLITQALTGSLSSSTRLLSLAMFLGGLMLGASTILTILVIRAGLFLNPQSGWVSLMLATLMFSGLILFFLGAIGFYVGKSFEEIRGRPTYLVETETGRAR
jgi:dolichol-phosphate mannosyltransferase